MRGRQHHDAPRARRAPKGAAAQRHRGNKSPSLGGRVQARGCFDDDARADAARVQGAGDGAVVVVRLYAERRRRLRAPSPSSNYADKRWRVHVKAARLRRFARRCGPLSVMRRAYQDAFEATFSPRACNVMTLKR